MHEGRLNLATFAPDGQTLYTGGADMRVVAWEPATGAARHLVGQHDQATLTALAVTPDGTWVMAGNYHGAFFGWPAMGGPQRVLDPSSSGIGHYKDLHAIAFTPDGRLAMTGGGSDDYQLLVWEMATGAVVGRGGGQDSLGATAGLVALPDGQRVLASSFIHRGVLHPWTVTGGAPKRGKAWGKSVDGLPLTIVGDATGRRVLAMGLAASMIYEDGEPVATLPGAIRGGFVGAGRVALMGFDWAVMLHDLAGGAPQKLGQVPSGAYFPTVATSADRVVVAGEVFWGFDMATLGRCW
ncbi:MAG: hypothetical protein JWM80_2565 [Cyanobacteria bacterium RYN_339]|nr:hypothetical protein [Cyanobacteria bacterium RYN_339]